MYIQKANIHLMMGEVENAVETMDQIIEIYPKSSDLWVHRGNELHIMLTYL
jgi:hypothetical protein